MFSSNLSPRNRLFRRSAAPARDVSEHVTLCDDSKRKASTSEAEVSLLSPRKSGDFHVLKESVDAQRKAVQEARQSLASCLDRLGEHHVRQKEYDEAMDAFAEALHEKRSIFSYVLSGIWFGQCPNLDVSCVCENSDAALHDKAVDEIVTTLRNMGNVHSLRGEQDEAMRYYTEVTNLRATKSSTRTENDDTTTLFSGIGADEDNSTLMCEINEDVKALDEMFRSISFRNHEVNSIWPHSRKGKTVLAATPENHTENQSSKRQKSDSSGRGSSRSYNLLDGELFRRSASSLCSAVCTPIPVAGSELSEALEAFKSVLENYQGPLLDQHKETFNSLALRVDLFSENALRPNTPSGSDAGLTVVDLELALEIFQHILKVQSEMQDSGVVPGQNRQLCANIASTLIRMGSLYYKLGNRPEELRMYKEAKNMYSRAFGENHAFVAGTRKNIGMVLAERGEYEEAMEEFEKARQVYISVNNEDETNRDVASAISCMGNVKNRIGELDAALKLYMEAVRIYRILQQTPDTPEGSMVAVRDLTSTLKVIGIVHAKKGDLDTAMNFFTEAMTILKSSGIDQTPAGCETTASILTRMASIHVKKGDLDNAMEHYREAYELTVRIRGTTSHQEVAGILHYIGGIFHKRADYDEAMNCYQEAIRIYHSTLGPGNPAVAGTLVMVGSIHYKRRNLDSAMMFYREALRLNRDTYGLHHPDVAPILKSIGTILTKKGEYHEAYDVFRDVLSIKCTVFGTVHPEVASAYKSLGNVHYKLGELADSERQYRHALNIYRQTRGEGHPDTIAARTTIEHIRYWMKERTQRKLEQRHSHNSEREDDRDERSC